MLANSIGYPSATGNTYPVRASPPVRLYVRLFLYSRREKNSRGTHGLTVRLISRPAYFFFKNVYFVHE